ncbi:hypothetical protein [Nocardioides daejeonensis]|uniref:hypothetical protein n=1 Tax=Nocardioides daejeonensis TaxID=1046556 RepID=UPI000D750B32|nr:hypothetical protein [Nocardioides daejeonensis]
MNDARYVETNARLPMLLSRIKPTGSPYQRHRPGCVITAMWWMHWPCLFPQHGRGPKHTRRIALERWQQRIVHDQPAALLRGLFHSDGARVANWATRPLKNGVTRRYAYPRWQFSNRSDDIHRICQDALDLAGVPWRRSSAVHTSVSTRAGVAALDALIGPKR